MPSARIHSCQVSLTVTGAGADTYECTPRPANGLSLSCLQYSLPTPRGGKYAVNPHLTEDQRFPQLRLSRKARQKTDVFAPDYVAGLSPFAENDISSRSAMLQVRDNTLGAGRRRLNPNASRKKFVKKRWNAKFHRQTRCCCSCRGVLVSLSPAVPVPETSAWRTGLACARAFMTPVECWAGFGVGLGRAVACEHPGWDCCYVEGDWVKMERTVPRANLQPWKKGASKS